LVMMLVKKHGSCNVVFYVALLLGIFLGVATLAHKVLTNLKERGATKFTT